MNAPHPARKQSPPSNCGFALLITITLLSFLVLLLVSLASLTRVETQVASNNQQLSQARQNALMALNIAIGQLQKYAGPDQRTTARADVNAVLADTTIQSGRWLGVYGRGVAAANVSSTARDLYSDIPSKIQTDIVPDSAANGNQAVLLNWLVSGNETTSFNPSTAVDANGQIDRTKAPTVLILFNDSCGLFFDAIYYHPLSVAQKNDRHKPAQSSNAHLRALRCFVSEIK